MSRWVNLIDTHICAMCHQEFIGDALDLEDGQFWCMCCATMEFNSRDEEMEE